MSNSLAIATVTASLRNLLQSAFNTNAPDTLDGADVSTLSPSDVNVTRKGANIYLYQVTPNAALRNQALPSRNSSGGSVLPATIALDLHYLVSFYGNDATWEPQRFLAIALQTFDALPVLGRRLVAQTVQNVGQTTDFGFITNSDLADGPQLVRLTLATLSLEELSRLWSVMLQTKYVVSVLYQASVVLIDSRDAAGPAPPVLERRIFVNPTRMLVVRHVIEVGGDTPNLVSPGAEVAVPGVGLAATGLAVFIDGVRTNVSLTDQTDTRIQFVLPAPLRAGAHSLSVASFVGTLQLAVAESSPVAFAVRPQVAGAVSFPSLGPTPGLPGHFDGSVSVPVSPAVAVTQRADLLLNQKDAAAGEPAHAAVLSRRPALPGESGETSSLGFDFAALPAGTYLLRLRVDGVESRPAPLSDGTLGPTLTVP